MQDGVVIDSEDFRHRYGGQIEASRESSTLRQYSALDGDSLTALPLDDAWSNEGPFAFPQGLRRLRELGRDRVDTVAVSGYLRAYWSGAGLAPAQARAKKVVSDAVSRG